MRLAVVLAALILACPALRSADSAAMPISAAAAAAPSPALQSPASPTAEASAVSPAAEAEPQIEDDAEPVSPTPQLDLGQAETRLLAKIAESLEADKAKLYFNIEENTAGEGPGAGMSEIDVAALYAELAKRTVADDAQARAALQSAALRDSRAIAAKNEAYAERLAQSLIKRLENGDKAAKDELLKLALKGNARARLYLGLDKPAQVSATAQVLSPTAAPAALSPGAEPAALSGSAK